jgi:hypothetical protein
MKTDKLPPLDDIKYYWSNIDQYIHMRTLWPLFKIRNYHEIKPLMPIYRHVIWTDIKNNINETHTTH